VPELYLVNELATEQLGVALAKMTPQGGTWLLKGDLGAGKTTWARGFVEGLGGAPDQVSSPTYAVLHRYEVPTGSVFHLDLYRVGASGIWSLGLEDSIASEDWLLVEWAEGECGPWASHWVSCLDLAIAPRGGRNAAWRGSILAVSESD
jgi:tRNA threonylcarbamoyladenosine biosynthesis protein TsaE